MKKMLTIILVCLFIGAASAETKRFSVPVEGSPVIGAPNATVTIVEFIDYQ